MSADRPRGASSKELFPQRKGPEGAPASVRGAPSQLEGIFEETTLWAMSTSTSLSSEGCFYGTSTFCVDLEGHGLKALTSPTQQLAQN